MTTTYGTRLRAAREKAGMTQMDVIVRLRMELPEAMWVSQTKLQRMEADKIDEAEAEPFLLDILAAIYGVDLNDISETAVETLARYSVFVEAHRGAGPSSACITDFDLAAA